MVGTRAINRVAANPQTNRYTELKKDKQGRFKSEQLNSFLKMETIVRENSRSHWLRVYDLRGNLRLNKADAQQQRADAQQQHAEAEYQRAESEHQRVQELEALVRQLKNQP